MQFGFPDRFASDDLSRQLSSQAEGFRVFKDSGFLLADLKAYNGMKSAHRQYELAYARHKASSFANLIGQAQP